MKAYGLPLMEKKEEKKQNKYYWSFKKSLPM